MYNNIIMYYAYNNYEHMVTMHAIIHACDFRIRIQVWMLLYEALLVESCAITLYG